jgi:hypothetical protein
VLGEVSGARLTALENRASVLLPDGQRRKALEKGHKEKYSNSLLGGMPLSPTRFSTQEFHVAVESMFGVGLTCFTPFTDSTPKSKACTADKRVDDYGNNTKKLPGTPGGGTSANHIAGLSTVSRCVEPSALALCSLPPVLAALQSTSWSRFA